MQVVGRRRLTLELPLDLREGIRVEQVAQLLLPEELAEQVAIERERLRAPLRGRRVVLVHVARDVVEEERRAVRRGALGLDLDEVDLPRLQTVEQPAQRGQVEDVLETLAVGLEHDRERAVLARDLEERLRLQPLLPERCPLPRIAPRDEQRARRVFAEARAEERGVPDLGHHEVLDLGRVDEEVVPRRRGVGIGKVQRDPVIRPDRLNVRGRATRAAVR